MYVNTVACPQLLASDEHASKTTSATTTRFDERKTLNVLPSFNAFSRMKTSGIMKFFDYQRVVVYIVCWSNVDRLSWKLVRIEEIRALFAFNFLSGVQLTP
jgi:hypothetical protein